VKADGLVGDQIGRHGDDDLAGGERAYRGFDTQALAGMVDQAHRAIERQRARRAIGRDQRAIAAPRAPIDVGVLIGVHVQDRDLVEFAAVDVGRNRVDHRVPAIAGLKAKIGSAVRGHCRGLSRGLLAAVIEFVDRAQ